MPEATARALSVTRSPHGRRSSPAGQQRESLSAHLSLSPTNHVHGRTEDDGESGSIYHDPLGSNYFSELDLEDETIVDNHGLDEDADPSAHSRRFGNELRPTLTPEVRSLSQEQAAAKQWWFDLMLQFRTHVSHLDYVAQQEHSGLPINIRRQDGVTKPESSGEQLHFGERGIGHHDPTALCNDITNEESFLDLTTGYYAYLCRIRRRSPEAALPVWHAFRSLGSRWTTDRRIGVRDEGFLVTVPSGCGQIERLRVDLTQEQELRAFHSRLSTPKSAEDDTICALIIPDLSPLFIELVGGLLRLDHHVFTNHLWSEHRRPFLLQNRHALEFRADVADPQNTFTLDIDTNAVTYVSGSRPVAAAEKAKIRQRLLSFFRQNALFFPFLDRAFDAWPASLTASPDLYSTLASSFNATSRATIHWIERPDSPVQVIILLTPSSSWALGGSNEYTYKSVDYTVYCRDDNDCFLHVPQPSSEQLAEPPIVDESTQYCTDIERLLQSAQAGRVSSGLATVRLDILSLEYLATKFISSTKTHLQADSRRLVAFRLTYDPVARRKTGPLGAAASAYAAEEPDAEAANDPLRDLQFLRDRVTQRQQRGERLMHRLAQALAVPSASSTGIASAQYSTLQVLYEAFPPLLKSINHLQSSINHAQSDIASSLQRRLTLLQLEEARKSIAQGAMVRKLTILAFVFVPVSATASAFGMNIAPLLSDPPPVWSFVIAAIGLTGVLVGLASADAIASIARGLRDGRTQRARVQSRGTRSAGEAMWLAKLAKLPWAILWVLVDLMRLVLLPLALGLRILQHIHAEGQISRQRERREVDALVRARFAFRESPWKIWRDAWSRAWRGEWQWRSRNAQKIR